MTTPANLAHARAISGLIDSAPGTAPPLPEATELPSDAGMAQYALATNLMRWPTSAGVHVVEITRPTPNDPATVRVLRVEKD